MLEKNKMTSKYLNLPMLYQEFIMEIAANNTTKVFKHNILKWFPSKFSIHNVKMPPFFFNPQKDGPSHASVVPRILRQETVGMATDMVTIPWG